MRLILRREYQKIYARLSEGGEANLEITSRDDPLNSDVYIKVKPKGKHMIKIDALSGGEKSVAVLALILSFQIKNPSPIYYLDEVDMFLDGHNAEHVGELFMENSKTSQVVMVSLKGAVTKFADNLIAVTTDKKGNTKIIQKRIGEGLGAE
jgi:chromosome segregation protein